MFRWDVMMFPGLSTFDSNDYFNATHWVHLRFMGHGSPWRDPWPMWPIEKCDPFDPLTHDPLTHCLLLWRICNTLCTSGFVDDVIFDIMEWISQNQRRRVCFVQFAKCRHREKGCHLWLHLVDLCNAWAKKGTSTRKQIQKHNSS